MVRCRICCSKQIFTTYCKRHASSNAYYVLLPEIPPDTAETNPVMRVNELPQFSDITPSKVITGCAKLAINYDVQLGQHIEHLKDPDVEKSFSSVFDPIEKIAVPLNYAWRTAKNLSYVKGFDGYKTAFQRIHPQVERAKNERWISKPLFEAVKTVDRKRSSLDGFQQRLVDMYLLEGRLNGAELSPDNKKKLIEILGKLVEAKNHFRNRVMLSHNLFSHVIDDFNEVVNLPKTLVAAMAQDKSNPSRGPWKLTLNQVVYQPFLEHCTSRMMRWNLWQAYNNRAAIGQDEQNLSNHVIIKDIRQHRSDIAKVLGYENFAEMSMETKMAGSVDNVLGMIESLKTKFGPLAEEEIGTLQEFAMSEGFHANLEMWDLPYWRRRHKEHTFKLNLSEVSSYLPFNEILGSLLKLCQQLFAIQFKDCTSEVDTWNRDVRFLKVQDAADGRDIASLYIDPYSRPHEKLAGSWIEAGREHSQLMGTQPVCYLNLNLAPPYGGRASLLSVDEAATLFYEMGHGLQQMLTTVPFSEIAGQRNVEWDSLQTCAMLFVQFFYHPHVLQAVSHHHETGAKMPMETVHEVLKMRRHLSAYDMMRQLYLSAFDMEMYISEEPWKKTMQNLWPEFCQLPLCDDDNHPCSLSSIFSDQYPAAYYSFQWAEMIAADIFGAFEEVGLDQPEKLAEVGLRFRETFLSLGGGVAASEVFRRFRGRDPSQKALIQSYETNHDAP